jgi:hypothetical protein
MFRTQNTTLDIQRMSEKRLSLGVIALKEGGMSSADRGFEGLRIFWPQYPPMQVLRALQLFPRLRV